MRKDGLWHPALVSELTRLGHGDTVVLADAGLPVPEGTTVIDLVWSRGEPRLVPLLRSVLTEFIFEQATIAGELVSLPYGVQMLEQLASLPVTRVPHSDFKALVSHARLVVRTGEDSPFMNVILHAGVDF